MAYRLHIKIDFENVTSCPLHKQTEATIHSAASLLQVGLLVCIVCCWGSMLIGPRQDYAIPSALETWAYNLRICCFHGVEN